MDLQLQGKVALVLGAGGGLGGAMAEALAREGVKVAITGRRAEPLEARAKVIREAGGTALPIVWDWPISTPSSAWCNRWKPNSAASISS